MKRPEGHKCYPKKLTDKNPREPLHFKLECAVAAPWRRRSQECCDAYLRAESPIDTAWTQNSPGMQKLQSKAIVLLADGVQLSAPVVGI